MGSLRQPWDSVVGCHHVRGVRGACLCGCEHHRLLRVYDYSSMQQMRTNARAVEETRIVGQISNPETPELLRGVYAGHRNRDSRDFHEPSQVRPGFQQRRGHQRCPGMPQHLGALVG